MPSLFAPLYHNTKGFMSLRSSHASGHHHHHRASASVRASSAFAASRAGKTDAAVKTHQAINRLFAKKKAEEQHGKGPGGKGWSGSHDGGAKSALAAHYTEEQIAKIVAEGMPAAGDSPTKRIHFKEGASCFVINALRQLHKYERPEGSHSVIQNERYSYSEQLHNYNRQQAIIRHERTIPERRVLDRYVNITAAQEGLYRVMPTHESVSRRIHEGWALNNEYRQQMAHGAPLMTRVMQGEFYAPEAKYSKPPSYIAANKKNVRDASRVSSVANRHRSGSALPTPRDAPQPPYVVERLRAASCR